MNIVLFAMFAFSALELQAQDTAVRQNYPLVGIVIGTPSFGVDAILGYDFGPVELRLSGGIDNPVSGVSGLPWGVQADFGYKLVDTGHFVALAGLFGNYIDFKDPTEPRVAGIGVSGSAFLYGFFASLGLGINFIPSGIEGLGAIGAFLNFDAQFGYMLRFWRNHEPKK
jgi:hypothetical protein